MTKPLIYFTSDWHVGHENCLKFDERPFKNLDHMHEELVSNFNHLVPKHGITYFLGDMGLCSKGLLRSVISRLNGLKILVRGNHDGNMYSMYNAGFDLVLDKAQINIGDSIITMTHCPLKGVRRENTTGMRGASPGENWHKEYLYKDKFSIEDFGQFHLHGHVHARGVDKNGKHIIEGRQMDVGVPAWNYMPVSISKIESWVNLYNQKAGVTMNEEFNDVEYGKCNIDKALKDRDDAIKKESQEYGNDN